MTVRADLLGQDVGVAGMAGDLSDHARDNEPQAYLADDVMLGSVVEIADRSQFVRTQACSTVFADHGAEGFVSGNTEADVGELARWFCRGLRLTSNKPRLIWICGGPGWFRTSDLPRVRRTLSH